MKRLFFVITAALLLCSCGSCSPFTTETPTSILCWNVQNLFDASDNGGEYPEFDPSGGVWNESLFHDRLERISKVIIESCPPRGPDLLILLEVENRNTIEQLNRYYLNRCGYRNRVTAAGEHGVRAALLTRGRLREFRSHRLSPIPTQPDRHFRDILEAEVDLPCGPLVIYANHWKSRLGGAEQTEVHRIRAASLLGSLVEKRKEDEAYRDHGFIICGDLNESHDQFDRWNRTRLTALMPANFPEREIRDLKGFREYSAEFACDPGPLMILDRPLFQTVGAGLQFYTPWERPGVSDGSYYYRGDWETLDHFLLDRSLFEGRSPGFADFRVVEHPLLLTGDGTPMRWITRLRSGTSDHLPILLLLR